MAYDLLTPEDVHDWLENDVTRLFFEYCKKLASDYDAHVHAYLQRPDGFMEAAVENAGIRAIVDVNEIPQKMKDDLKENDLET